MRIRGSAPKSEIKNYINNLKNNPEKTFPELKNFKEVEKKPWQEKIIKKAQEIIKNILKDLDIPPSHKIDTSGIHIVPSEVMEKVYESEAVTKALGKEIILNDEKTRRKIVFAVILFHELLHAYAHVTIEAHEETGIVSIYRNGIQTHSPQKRGPEKKKAIHFIGTHEGTVAMCEKKFFQELISDDDFEEERKAMASKEVQKILEILRKEKGISQEEIYWLNRNTNELNGFSYPEQRKVIKLICETLKKMMETKYPTEEAVFKEFLRAHFTGRLLELGRDIEAVFGKGSFRELGTMTEDPESATAIYKIFSEKLKGIKKHNAIA